MNEHKVNVYHGDVAMEKLLTGVNTLGDAVSVTLGPRGKNVIIQKQFGGVHITKDGVTVAKSINLPNDDENVGCVIVREAASQTADAAGDGTTTSTVIAQELINTGHRYLSKYKPNLNLFRKGIEKATKDVLLYIEKNSRKVTTDDEIKNVATISANNDEVVGEIILAAKNHVGLNGVITVEESQLSETLVEKVEGMRFNKGFTSPYFITDSLTHASEYVDPYILIYDGILADPNELIPVLNITTTENRPLYIIADDIRGDAHQMLIMNKIRSGVKVTASKSPGFGDDRKELLFDIACLTGGIVVSKDKGMKLQNITKESFGQCGKIVVTKDHSTIIGGKGDLQDITDRVSMIKQQYDVAETPYIKEKLKERIAKITGGISIIRVGGNSELEMKERKDRIDDAVNAVMVAISDGIIPGGGVTLLRASNDLKTEFLKHKTEDEDYNDAYLLLLSAIQVPFKRILSNASASYDLISHSILHNINLETMSKYDNANIIGFDANAGVIVENMFDSGIIDPVKVTRVALTKAVSVAVQLLTTECLITTIKEKDNEQV